jgi:hypothetical protein
MGSWSRSEKIGACSLCVAIVACAGTLLTVQEFRALIHFETPSRTSVEREFADGSVTTPDIHAGPQAAEPAVTQNRGALPTVPDSASSREGMLTEIIASASSILPTSPVASYEASRVLDNDASTVWVEGAEGYGLGEWIQLDLRAPALITRLQIANGYDRGPRFYENARVERALLAFSDGTIQAVAFNDERGMQDIPISPVRTTFVRLTIQSTYSGTRWQDTAVGELRLWGTQ